MWAPYIIRKLDHAFMMGRRATWGKLTMRPSDGFKQHCFVDTVPRGGTSEACVVEAGDRADRVRLGLSPR